MSELIPNVLPLDKGLDLQTAKIIAPPGSILDSLNYEQVDFQGQKRIDGYTRYDGSPLSAIDDFYLVPSSGQNEDGSWVPQEGTVQSYPPYHLMFNTGGTLYGVQLNVNVESPIGTNAVVAIIDYNNLPDGEWGKDSELSIEQHYDLLLQYNAFLRANVEELPGPIIGLHWFRDRLYAVVNISDYTPDDDRIDTANNASLFESRNFQQVLDEDSPGPYDFGWKFVHQGWLVNFENGKVLFGELISKNQNVEGVGVQGPTSIVGTAGSPLNLVQKVAITNGTTQVNGWKSSDTPLSYVLNPNDVVETDTKYTYADAYVSWNGSTGVISAPGSNGLGLVEYPASNTVEVEI